MKQRKLSDLFVRGKDVTLDDGEGEKVTVYLRKLSPVELESVLRMANAKRARYVAAFRDEDSPEYIDVVSASVDLLNDRSQCMDIVAGEKLANRYAAIEAEVASQDEWAEDNYLQGLLDAQQELQEGDPDFERVTGELLRFYDAVNEFYSQERERIQKDYEGLSDEELADQALKVLLRNKANVVWMTELRYAEVFYATRDAKNHQQRYFTSRDELDPLPAEVLRPLFDTYRDLNVDVVEGKGLQPTQDS